MFCFVINAGRCTEQAEQREARMVAMVEQYSDLLRMTTAFVAATKEIQLQDHFPLKRRGKVVGGYDRKSMRTWKYEEDDDGPDEVAR